MHIFSLLLLFLGCLSLHVSAYFVITEPTKTTVWSNGRVNVMRWSKGLLDGVFGFDVELSRMSSDGLTLVARNVPTTKTTSLNILLQDVPPGDDYVLMFINATHGVMHAISPKFSILEKAPSSLGDGQTAPDADPKAATVTVSGGPDPTKGFATTFPPVVGGAVKGALEWRGIAIVFAAVAGGAFITLL
jgi:hypothetical protein